VTTTREPRDKLDAPAAAGANGPKDKALDWDAVDWRRVEGDVRRLRQRIFTASLEPCAGMTCTHGSEGAPAQQCAGATRHGLPPW
jgi:hypothetical protein